MAKRVAVINFKGGVGKTTLALHLGCHLGAQGHRVLLVDVDHQSTLSVTCLDPAAWEAIADQGITVNQIHPIASGDSPEAVSISANTTLHR